MTAFHQSRGHADAAVEKLRVFAQAQRLMILSCLLHGERHVGEIERATGIAQPALSQQLGELRRAELVRTRREAKLIYYALADEKVATCVRTMEAMFGETSDPDVASLAVPMRPTAPNLSASPLSINPSTPSAAAAFARIG